MVASFLCLVLNKARCYFEGNFKKHGRDICMKMSGTFESRAILTVLILVYLVSLSFFLGEDTKDQMDNLKKYADLLYLPLSRYR